MTDNDRENLRRVESYLRSASMLIQTAKATLANLRQIPGVDILRESLSQMDQAALEVAHGAREVAK